MDAKPVLNAYSTQLTSNPALFNDRAEMQDPLLEGRSPHTPTNPRGDSNMKNYCPNVLTNLTSGENYGDGVAAAAP